MYNTFWRAFSLAGPGNTILQSVTPLMKQGGKHGANTYKPSPQRPTCQLAPVVQFLDGYFREEWEMVKTNKEQCHPVTIQDGCM